MSNSKSYSQNFATTPSGPRHVVFSGGGTGGHLFPGMAVADLLRAACPSWRITFCGNGQRFERSQVHRAGYTYRGFPCRPLPRGPRGSWRFIRDHIRGGRSAREFLVGQGVSLVVGLGGYASVPMARAAIRHGVPLILLEQNIVAGRATTWLAPRAQAICLAYEHTRIRTRSPVAVRITGNPVRSEFLNARRNHGSGSRFVVMGGSQGASELNEGVPRALHKVRHLLVDWQVVHVCGEALVDSTQTLYRKLNINAEAIPFCDDPGALLAGSAFTICRSGGTTLAELAVMGLPAVLVPYRDAAADHQRLNANLFAHAGAAVTVDSRDLPGRLDDNLAAAMLPLLMDEQVRTRMSRRMFELGRPGAAADVAQGIQDILGGAKLASAA